MTRRALGVAALLVMSIAARGRAQPAPAIVLDVPYVSQTEDLCGGAAAAMVMRFWGERGIAPNQFASIVDPKAHGISSEALASALTARGWRAYSLAGSDALARHHVEAGRPVVALIQVSPSRRHYVVIVSWTSDRVVVHDPALAPFRSVSRATFDREWRATGRLMLLVLPPHGGVESPARAEAYVAPPSACARLMAQGIARVSDHAVDAAITDLRAAHAACPESSAPLTELAGLQLLQSDLQGAAETALQATSLNPADVHAWRTLATSRYLLRDTAAALDAWNQVGEPVLDLVRVNGLTRTKHGVAARAIGLAPGSVLTADALVLGRRRLEDLPAASASRLEYAPVGHGQTELRAAIAEPSAIPSGWFDAGGVALGAAINRELAWTFTSLTGNGEAVAVQWRWWENRPRVSVSASVPVRPGILTIHGFVERQTFAASDNAQPVVDDRRSVSAGLHNWATPWLRWDAGVGVDRWTTLGTLARVTGGLDVRAAADRLALGVETTLWPDRNVFGSIRTGIRWRSSAVSTDAAISAAIDGAVVTGRAPHDLWPGADTGQATSTLLRAHPSLVRGVIVSEAFGRQLAHASGEWQSRALQISLARIRGAVFMDAARAWQGDHVRNRALVDTGVGVRMGLSGRGTIRVDVGHGLTDGANAISMDWVLPWPRPW
jgi:hypothetical protein